MDQDSKLLTEAYLTRVNEYTAPSNRGKGHHGEGLSKREEIEIDIQDLDKRSTEADANGNTKECERLDRMIDELRTELRKMAPRSASGRMHKEAIADDDEDSYEDPADEPIEDLSSYEDFIEDATKGIEHLIERLAEWGNSFGDDAMKARREVGDIMVEKIYRELMGINSTSGYKHEGRVFGQ